MNCQKEYKCVEENESILSDEINAKFLILTKTISNNLDEDYITKENNQYKTLMIIPNIFIMLFFIMFLITFIKFFPTFVVSAIRYKLYKEKFEISYFSQFFSGQPIFVNLIVLLTLFTQGFMLGYYFKLINQRLSVPELVKEKKINNFILASTIISIISLLGLTFFNKESLSFSKNILGLCENFLYLFFLISLFFICYFSLDLINKLEISGVNKNSYYLSLKRSLILFLIISLCIYSFTLLVISYYSPHIRIEKYFTSIFIICKEIYSILFLVFFSMFSFTFKYDFQFLLLNLIVRPDVEYFYDISDININFV